MAALAAYDDAFDKFFARLGNKGIDRSNTLFVVTADENDHFVGGAPTPADCDGICRRYTMSPRREYTANSTVPAARWNQESLALRTKGFCATRIATLGCRGSIGTPVLPLALWTMMPLDGMSSTMAKRM